jgi:hypothetical protein
MAYTLSSWTDGPTKSAITDFVARVIEEGGRDYVEPPSLRLLLLHDDADREFDYTAGAEQALEAASREHWTVVSVKNDWNTVFTGDT